MVRSSERRILIAAKRLIGLQITGMRYMTQRECTDLYIDNRAVVLTLSDGSLLYPIADDEGNDAGVLIAQAADGQELRLSRLPR